MLSKPKYGWTTITIEDWQTEASYLFDVPFEWLRACLNAMEYNIPICLFVDEEGSCCYINSYYNNTYIIIERDETTLHNCRNTDFFDLTYSLITDIKHHFEDWVKWYPYEESEDDFIRRKKELKRLIDKTENSLYAAAEKRRKSFAEPNQTE